MEKYLCSFRGRRYFNEELVANILSFLPAKSVAKVKVLDRCVHRLVSEDYFILLQSRRAEAADSGFFAAYKYGADICFVDQQAGVPTDAFEFLRSAATILSSVNGLIIYLDRTLAVPDGIAVYNPVRRTSLSVPAPPDTELSHDHFVGVGAIVCKGAWSFDYKLVYAEPAAEWGGNLRCKIYDSRDGEWKADAVVRGAAKRNLRLDEPVVCGSAVFWASTCGAYVRGVDPYVVALDVDAAAAPSSRIVPLPAEAVATGSPDEYEIRIARWGDTGPCLIQYREPASVFAMWSLATTKTNYDEDAAAAAVAWKKICEVGFEEMQLRKKQVGSFTLLNGDILVFITLKRRLYSYSLSSRQLKKLGRVDSPYSALIPYANTLRPCGRDGEVVAEK